MGTCQAGKCPQQSINYRSHKKRVLILLISLASAIFNKLSIQFIATVTDVSEEDSNRFSLF